MPWLALVSLVALWLSGCTKEVAGPQSGEVLYRRYCASCHGLSGHGDGPAAPSLAPSPTDLTRLDAGAAELMEWIDGRRTVRAHGTAAMPVWGELFEASLIGEPNQRRTALLQVQAIADYVQRLRAGATEDKPGPAHSRIDADPFAG
jgi:mono/diheme cytochrome c family protein